ncbi:MAG: hypothetical protein ACRDGS_06210 [Chloroflexota bacterium]
MDERAFDLATFCDRVGATPKERSALRQDLVRGLKDYYESHYGYDRYGAETVFMVQERMGQPYIYGFGLLRVLRDRRITPEVKIAAAETALDVVEYGADMGIPFGFFEALRFLGAYQALSLADLRYALTVTAGEQNPLQGLDRAVTQGFFDVLLARTDLPETERLFWSHSLLARHPDLGGASALINLVMGNDDLSIVGRLELCHAWMYFRQPKLTVETPYGNGERGVFVSDHMGFWVAHMPSWPSAAMMKLALIWRARLGENPSKLAERYVHYRDTYAAYVLAGVADVLAEFHNEIPKVSLISVIEVGVEVTTAVTRRRYYRLGAELLRGDYLERATRDTASSVRQWANLELQKRT